MVTAGGVSIHNGLASSRERFSGNANVLPSSTVSRKIE
jgi:hypothetical protein